MIANNTPVPHGASRVSHLHHERYVYQPYPSVRFHPDGSERLVQNEAEDAALGEPWRDRPYPKPAVEPPAPEPTTADLKSSVTSLAQENADLKAQVQKLTQENAGLTSYSAEQATEIIALSGALAAAKKAEKAAAKAAAKKPEPADKSEAPKSETPKE